MYSLFSISVDTTIVIIKVIIQLIQLSSNKKVADSPFIRQCANTQGNIPLDTFLIVANA